MIKFIKTLWPIGLAFITMLIYLGIIGKFAQDLSIGITCFLLGSFATYVTSSFWIKDLIAIHYKVYKAVEDELVNLHKVVQNRMEEIDKAGSSKEVEENK